MNDREHANLKLVVPDEKALYTPLSPEPELTWSVQSYLKAKAAGEDSSKIIDLTVISDKPLDEDRFRAALSNFIKDEKKKLKIEQKNTFRTLIGLLIFGSVMLILSLAIIKHNQLLQYSILPIMGSMSLGRAVRILILEYPTIKTENYILKEMEEESKLTFQYNEVEEK